MKNRLFRLIALIIVILMFTATVFAVPANNSNNGTNNNMLENQISKKPPLYTGAPDEWFATEAYSGDKVADLFSDISHDVGNLYISRISDDDENYLVTYEITEEDWFLTEIHFEGIADGELVYLQSKGGLIPGKFTVKESFDIGEEIKVFSFYYYAGDEIEEFTAHAVISQEVLLDGYLTDLPTDGILTEIVNESAWAYTGEFERVFKNWSQHFNNEVANPEEISIVLITDESGLEDGIFNRKALEGLENAEHDYGVTFTVIESESADDYLDNLTIAALAGPDLIITVGYNMIEATSEAAVLCTSQAFAIIDGFIDKPNVTSITFKEHEGSFLVGVIAGVTNETTTVGFIGGIQFPLIEKFQYGYMAGVKMMSTGTSILVDYVGSFSDFDLGKAYAVSQQALGADIIYQAAGYSGFGVIEATSEGGIWAIGVDVDQSYLSPESVLCSMIKKVDTAAYLLAQSLVFGNFNIDYYGKNVELGLKEDGVDYSDNAGNLATAAIAAAEFYRAEIIAENIIVPYDSSTYTDFLSTLP